jgi:hypothetical protein
MIEQLFLTNQARELPIYIKKKISSKWTHTDTTTTNNYAKKTNSTKGKKTTTVVGRIGSSTQTAHSQSSTQKKRGKEPPPTPNHHTAPPTLGHQGRQGENAIVTARTIVTDDDPHRASLLPSRTSRHRSLRAI